VTKEQLETIRKGAMARAVRKESDEEKVTREAREAPEIWARLRANGEAMRGERAAAVRAARAAAAPADPAATVAALAAAFPEVAKAGKP